MRRKLILPGEYVVTRESMLLETLVGSCVAVCIFNRNEGLAGMNHFVLPRQEGGKVSEMGKYGQWATERIISQMLKSDSQRGHYRAMIFGGGNVLATGGPGVGAENVQAAVGVLSAYRIRICDQQTGGEKGRRVRFYTDDGRAVCRFSGQLKEQYC